MPPAHRHRTSPLPPTARRRADVTANPLGGHPWTPIRPSPHPTPPRPRPWPILAASWRRITGTQPTGLARPGDVTDPGRRGELLAACITAYAADAGCTVDWDQAPIAAATDPATLRRFLTDAATLLATDLTQILLTAAWDSLTDLCDQPTDTLTIHMVHLRDVADAWLDLAASRDDLHAQFIRHGDALALFEPANNQSRHRCSGGGAAGVIGKAAAGIAAAIIGMLLFCAGTVGIFLTGGAGTDTGTATSTSCDTTLTAGRPDRRSEQRQRPAHATVPTVARSYPPVGRWDLHPGR